MTSLAGISFAVHMLVDSLYEYRIIFFCQKQIQYLIIITILKELVEFNNAYY